MMTRQVWYRVVYTAGDVPTRPSEDLANTPRTASARGYWRRDAGGRKLLPAGKGRWQAIFCDPASTLTDAEIAEVNRQPQDEW